MNFLSFKKNILTVNRINNIIKAGGANKEKVTQAEWVAIGESTFVGKSFDTAPGN